MGKTSQSIPLTHLFVEAEVDLQAEPDSTVLYTFTYEHTQHTI